MNLQQIISEIDAQIEQLQKAKALLTYSATPKKVGRPAKVLATTIVVKGRKPLSAEAKARIAAAQKKRWAKARKTTAAVKKAAPVIAKKAPAKKASSPAKAVLVKTA